MLNTPLSTPILGLLEYSKKVGHDCDGNRVCAAWPEETGVTSQFIKSHYIPVKGGFNFSGIPIALTYYIPVHILCIIQSREATISIRNVYSNRVVTRYRTRSTIFNVNFSTRLFWKNIYNQLSIQIHIYVYSKIFAHLYIHSLLFKIYKVNLSRVFA